MNDGMDSRRSIHGDRRPALPVFVAQMDEHRVGIVLDAKAVGGVRLLVERASLPSWECVVGDKGRPPSSSLWRSSERAAGPGFQQIDASVWRIRMRAHPRVEVLS
ncbi:MAG TPA: hypothetical protein VJT14_01220, partial [Candidatus Dormibacteraeota bacterium]|nr:hypothetical protein [Candidatus Dormibacteraeota bacterium]